MSREHPRSIAALAAIAIFFSSACSPAPAPVSQSSSDPSNPAAPEGMTPFAVSSSPAPIPASSPSTAADHSQHVGAAPASAGAASSPSSDAGAITYVCPMHPEVTSNAPGTCPKCNMKLVVQKK